MSHKNIIKYKKIEIEKELTNNNNNNERAGIMMSVVDSKKRIDVPSDGVMTTTTTTTTIDVEKAALNTSNGKGDDDDSKGKDDNESSDELSSEEEGHPKNITDGIDYSDEDLSETPDVEGQQQEHSKYIWLHAFYHSIVTIIGTGILGFPYATSYLGWYGGKLLSS